MLAKAGALAGVILSLAVPANAEDVRLESLTVDGNAYSNITVVGKTATHIEFKHAHGFASVKVKMLPDEVQIKLGYTPPPPPKTAMEITRDLRDSVVTEEQIQQLQTLARTEVERILAESDPRKLQLILGGVGFIYLLFCYAVYLICRKTTTRAGIWAWIPGFQFIALFKAAGMPVWNIFLLLVPIVNIVITVIWCFKIARTRQKSPIVGFLLLLPVINILAFLYLAFSSAPKAEPVKSEKLRLSFQPAAAR